jgi:hypothetical protein
MGRKLPAHLERAGFAIEQSFTAGDRELAFDGPAPPEIVAAWTARLDRMALLRRECADFDAVKRAFLGALVHPDHRSRASVRCCVARRSR